MRRDKKNNVYPCKPQLYYIKVGFKGVKIIYACFHDGLNLCPSYGGVSLLANVITVHIQEEGVCVCVCVGGVLGGEEVERGITEVTKIVFCKKTCSLF